MPETQTSDNPLGRAVASRRTALGLKRKDLAERARLSYPYISEIENGLKEPSAKALRQIADALDLTVAGLTTLAEELGAPSDVAPPDPHESLAFATVVHHPLGAPAAPDPASAATITSTATAPPTSSPGPSDLRRLVQAELERWTAEQLPELIEQAVTRALAAHGIEGDA